jgi:hypothetical protein
MDFQGPVIRHALELAKAVPACRHQKLLPNVARWKVVSRGMAGLEHPVRRPGLGDGLAGKAYAQSIVNLLQPRRPRIIPDRLLSRAGLYAFRSGQNRAPSGARSPTLMPALLYHVPVRIKAWTFAESCLRWRACLAATGANRHRSAPLVFDWCSPLCRPTRVLI